MRPACDDFMCASHGNDCCAGGQEEPACTGPYTAVRTGHECYGIHNGTYTCCPESRTVLPPGASPAGPSSPPSSPPCRSSPPGLNSSRPITDGPGQAAVSARGSHSEVGPSSEPASYRAPDSKRGSEAGVLVAVGLCSLLIALGALAVRRVGRRWSAAQTPANFETVVPLSAPTLPHADWQGSELQDCPLGARAALSSSLLPKNAMDSQQSESTQPQLETTRSI